MKNIQTKICTKCGIEKYINRFSPKESGRFGVAAKCKFCTKICSHKWYKENTKRALEYSRKRHEENPEKNRKRASKWAKENPQKVRKTGRKWAKENPEKTHQWQNANPGKARECQQRWREKNPNRMIAIRQKFCKENHEKLQKYYRERQQQKRKTSPKFKLNGNISCLIRSSLKNSKNGRHWETLVGYTLEKLKKHLEKRFKNGMTWGNYGRNGWWLDHKIPINVFNFTKPEHTDFKKCWALKNLQPMWAKENISKGMNLKKHFQPNLAM